MTGALPLWSSVGDGDLARAAADGDRQAFAEMYDRYADRLYDYCVGILGDRDAAADCVHDAFCVAATDLSTLREPDKLRPWLYSITRHNAMSRLRRRYREEVSDAVPDIASREVGPDTVAGQSELARLVADAAGGLSDRDRELLELSYRHGLDGPELAEALGVSLTNANTMVFRLRQTVERCLGALLVARGARADTNACPELAAVLKGWDGQFTVLMRKRIARHIESCQACAHEQRRRVNPVALLGGSAVFIPAPAWLRDRTLDDVQLTSASSGAVDTTGGAGGLRRIGSHAALLVGAPLVALGVAIVWFTHREAPIAPAVDIGTESTPSQGPVPSTAATNSPSTPPHPTPGPTPSTTVLQTRQPTSTAEISSPNPTPEVSSPPVTTEVSAPPVTTEVSAPPVTTEVSAPKVTPEVSAPKGTSDVTPPWPQNGTDQNPNVTPPWPQNGTDQNPNVTPPWPQNGTDQNPNVTPPWPQVTLPPLITPVIPIPVVPKS